MNRAAALLLAAVLAIVLHLQGFGPLTAQATSASERSEARSALDIARMQQRNARLRAEGLEEEARRASAASAKARIEAAALAARVQQQEASVATAEAELTIVERDRRALARDLARRREPLARLAGAIENLSRRPLVLSALQPGSLGDLVHTRAVLSSAVPLVQARTVDVRADLDRVRALKEERMEHLAMRRQAERALAERRRDMIALAEKERILADQASGGAAREIARAEQLAREAASLDALVSGLERAGTAASDGGKARLPGSAAQEGAAAGAPGRYILPVTGQVSASFGEIEKSGGKRSGIAIAARPEAQVVAPAAGRVAFAGTYEGYGQIVIIEHDGGWTSLVTGMADISVRTGQPVTGGSPLGLAPRRAARIEFELRRSGKPVNPLDHLR